jgi:hypothetical protein
MSRTLLGPNAAAEALYVRGELEVILARLDRLGLHEVGAHLSQAIHALDREIAVSARLMPSPIKRGVRPS